MTLYRLVPPFDMVRRTLREHISEGTIVEVEACVHGNYAPHISRESVQYMETQWCDGKPVGEEPE